MAIIVTGARAELADGTVVARIERVLIGGGERTRTIDGVPETTTDPQWEQFSVRLLSQAGPMVSDELVDAQTWDEAVAAAEAYAEKITANAGMIASLKQALK